MDTTQSKVKNKYLSKKAFTMILIGAILLVVMLVSTPLAFLASVNSEWKTRASIKSVAKTLEVNNSKAQLIEIAKSDRILDIIATDSTGTILYTIKDRSLFKDANATISYDALTRLYKFNGGRISYFQRNPILGALINVGDDDDFDFDDDDRYMLPYDYIFVKDNTYPTIMMTDAAGNVVYIICTQDYHLGFVLFLVFAIIAWSLLAIYFVSIQIVAIVDNAKKHGANTKLWGAVGIVPFFGVVAYVVFRLVANCCSQCGQIAKSGNLHCTKCGNSLQPKTCQHCQTQAKKSDIICGNCGKKLD